VLRVLARFCPRFVPRLPCCINSSKPKLTVAVPLAEAHPVSLGSSLRSKRALPHPLLEAAMAGLVRRRLVARQLRPLGASTQDPQHALAGRVPAHGRPRRFARVFGTSRGSSTSHCASVSSMPGCRPPRVGNTPRRTVTPNCATRGCSNRCALTTIGPSYLKVRIAEFTSRRGPSSGAHAMTQDGLNAGQPMI
jgi:hypothetical protein